MQSVLLSSYGSTYNAFAEVNGNPMIDFVTEDEKNTHKEEKENYYR